MDAKPSSQDSESKLSQPARPLDVSLSRSASSEAQKNQRDDETNQHARTSAEGSQLPTIYHGDGECEDEAEIPNRANTMSLEDSNEPPSGADVHDSGDYQYSPLPSTDRTIRLLCVYPAKSMDKPIICDMHQVQLDGRPDYAALSYTWGDPIFDRHIICEGRNLPVTQHLDTALRRFRATTWRWIWVDAVCIDQSNISERNQQVSMMRDIYIQAKMVFIYLGEAGQWDEEGIIHMKSVYEMSILVKRESLEGLSEVDRSRLIRFRECREAGFPGGATESSDWLGTGRPLPDYMKLTAAQAIFARAWFTRAWIVQEVAVGSQATVLLGPHRFPLNLIFAFSQVLHTLGLPSFDPSRTKEELYGSWYDISAILNLAYMIMERKSYKLIELLARFRMSHSSDPRDKVYSLIGLARNMDQALIIDYSKSVKDVYLDCAYHLVQTGDAMEMLIHAGIAQDRLNTEVASTLPSWVPDWSQGGSRYYAPDPELELDQAYGVSQQTVRIEDDRLGLNIKGIILDSLARFHCKDLDDSDMGTWAQDIMEEARPSRLYAEDDSGSNASVAVMFLPWKFPTRGYSQEMRDFAGISELQPPDSSSIQKLWSGLRELTREFKVCVTQDGHIGWVPLCSEAGDIICVFYGGYCPFVLRKTEEGYILVGVAWVKGYMCGEPFDTDGLEAYDFVLR